MVKSIHIWEVSMRITIAAAALAATTIALLLVQAGHLVALVDRDARPLLRGVGS